MSFTALKERQQLHFSYDPRGSKEADDRYCVHCKCPKSYCCETLFGKITKSQTELFIKEFGGLMKTEVTGDCAYYNFQKILSEQVHHKMLMNRRVRVTMYLLVTLFTH